MVLAVHNLTESGVFQSPHGNYKSAFDSNFTMGGIQVGEIIIVCNYKSLIRNEIEKSLINWICSVLPSPTA